MGADKEPCKCQKTQYSPRIYDVLYSAYGERIGVITSIVKKEKITEIVVEINP